MKPIRILCMLLAMSLLLLLLAACHSTDPAPTPETGDESASGSTEGLSTPLRYAEGSLPTIPDLTDWYADAVDREQLTNALLYSEENGVWHCWLYVGCHSEGDKTTVTVADGVLNIRVSAAVPAQSGARSVLYFTLESAVEPDANITVNGEDEGILLTHADTSVKP